MKKSIIIFLLALTGAITAAGQDLVERLKDYLAAIEPLTLEQKCAETDFIISSCETEAVRREVANQVYEHFLTSKVMGDEGVAIHVFDRWFSDGTIAMESEDALWNAKFFASVNRASLIGCNATQLTLEDALGEAFTLGPFSRYSVLFFYDTGCPKCRLESIMLRNVLENDNFDIDFYCIYVGTSKEKWTEYRTSELSFDAPNTKFYHLWDPSGNSGVETAYGVIQTPRIFLVNPQNVIIGRELDAQGLELMLSQVLPKEYEYGSEEAMALFSNILEDLGDGTDFLGFMGQYISNKTLGMGSVEAYRQMIGDLLYFASSCRNERVRCDAASFADEYVLERPDIWNSADDTLRVVGLASLLQELGERPKLGTVMPRLKVRAERLLPSGKRRAKTLWLNRIGRAVVVFHTDGCGFCRAEIEAAGTVARSKSMGKVYLVCTDDFFSEAEAYPQIMESLDLSSQPFILATDSKSRVVRKYMSLLVE